LVPRRIVIRSLAAILTQKECYNARLVAFVSRSVHTALNELTLCVTALLGWQRG